MTASNSPATDPKVAVPSPVKSMTKTATPKSAASTPPSTLLNDQAQDIPIFLRKTYHMIDTCDATVACWSEDGETFVVKDPVKFEKQIIPQFFKHSKFTSFVRQLNFYAFRKIKYADTIRIDPKLEAETANYWRFRHEKFQRGKPELLGEIKRMNGQKQQQKTKGSKDFGSSSSSVSVAPPQASQDKENVALKSEVTSLKQRIEAMTKNIDQLTTMVEKVTLQQEQQPTPPAPREIINVNNKRTKTEEDLAAEQPTTVQPDVHRSCVSSPMTAASQTAMDLDDFPLPPSIPSPMPVQRETTATSIPSSEISDDRFVDQLFTAFKTEDFEFDEAESVPPAPEMPSTNRPHPELMERLADALSLLPRDIQELIVDRLIQSITSPKEIQDNISAANALKEVNGFKTPVSLPPRTSDGDTKSKDKMTMGLAAATLAALLSQCSGDLKSKDATKTLLIPVHA